MTSQRYSKFGERLRDKILARYPGQFPHLEVGSKPVAKAANLSAYAHLLLKTTKPEDHEKEPALLPNPKPAKPVRHSFAHLRNAVFTYPPAAAVSATPTPETDAARIETAKEALRSGNATGDLDAWARRRVETEGVREALRSGNVVCDADVWATRRGG